jgi:O-antigen/teichoic acid export membrane protein
MLLSRESLISSARNNASFAALVKIISAGAGFIIGALLARLFSVEVVGAYFVFIYLVRVSSVLTRM